MKIANVKLTVFRRPLPGAATDVLIKGQSLMSMMTECTAIEIMTDEGVTGESITLGGGLGLAHYLEATMKPALIGRDPAFREHIWQDLWELNRLWWTPQVALGSIDVAVWDLYGKIIGAPIYQLLGAYRDKIPTYASSLTKTSVEEYAEEALDYKGRGYQGYKLHVWGDPNRDIKACRAVREAVGGGYPLMVDVVAAYTQTEALRVGRALEELDYLWYEEPLRDYDLHGYRMLCAALDIPIAAVEVNEGSMFTTPEYIVSRGVNIVRTDAAFKGGIGPVMKTAALAEAFGMNAEIHTVPASPLLEFAGFHCNLAVKNSRFFEQMVPNETFQFGLDGYISVDGEGYARLPYPDRPGLGVGIDWDYINRYKIAEL